jgi:hypothetical protein
VIDESKLTAEQLEWFNAQVVVYGQCCGYPLPEAKLLAWDDVQLHFGVR